MNIIDELNAVLIGCPKVSNLVLQQKKKILSVEMLCYSIT